MHILYTNTGPIKAASLPALHNGVFAGLGYRPDWSFVVYSGHLGAASDTPPHIIAAPGDPVPNVPNESFAFFRFPTVWNGSVYFPGKSGSGGPNPPDGAYFGAFGGEGVSVLSDRYNNLGPWIERPFAGAMGVAYVGPVVATGTGAGIYLYTYEHQDITLVSSDLDLADGTQVQSTSSSSVAYGDDTIVYSMRAGFPDLNATGHGVFAYDTTTGQTTRIARMDTPIPGDGRLMEFVVAGDTDGSLVTFVASHGHLYFGGTAAVCVVNVDGSDLRTIARTGQPMPGMPGRTYFSIGRAAVDNGIVYFQATYRDGANERLNLFAHVLATNTTIPLVLFTQVISGGASNTPWFDPRGVDGADVVVELERATANMGVSEFTLVHLHVNANTCDPIDFNTDGLFPDTQDIDDFLSVFSGGTCSTGTCGDIDFNNDTLFPDTADIDALISVFSGGACA